MSLKTKTSNKLKLRTNLKKADVWSPTKIKTGDPKDKTGNAWCKADEDGGAMNDCVSFWNDITLEVLFNYERDLNVMKNLDKNTITIKLNAKNQLMEINKKPMTLYQIFTIWIVVLNTIWVMMLLCNILL